MKITVRNIARIIFGNICFLVLTFFIISAFLNFYMNIMDFRVNNMCVKQKISEVNVMENASKITFGAVVLLLLVAIVLSAISVSVGFSIKNSVKAAGKNNVTEDVPANANVDGTSSTAGEKKAIYRVCSESGTVVVKNAVGKTVKTLDIRLSFLPEADRAALEKGIDIFTDGELSALIADYTR